VVGVLSAVLSMKAALATSGCVSTECELRSKSSFLLGFLESVPEIAAKLKEPNAKDMKFDDRSGTSQRSYCARAGVLTNGDARNHFPLP